MKSAWRQIEIYTSKKGGNVANWLKSYLSNRKQVVSIEGALSEELDVSHGVPQGSILGPLLYIIYTSDLPDSIHQHTDPDFFFVFLFQFNRERVSSRG